MKIVNRKFAYKRKSRKHLKMLRKINQEDNVRNAFLDMWGFIKSSGKKLFGFGPKIGQSRLKKLVEIINDWENSKNIKLILQ